MKYKKLLIAMAVGCISLFTLTACGKENTSDQSSTALISSDAASSSSVSSVESLPESEVTSDAAQSSDVSVSEPSEDVSSEASEASEGTVVATYEDNLDTYEFEVKEDGTYTFTDPVIDSDLYWDIYVLDEQFRDGVRFIKQAHEPSGQTPLTVNLKAGQWVYCFCSRDAFTSAEKIDCKLTITKQ